jgi:hypothetical protein
VRRRFAMVLLAAMQLFRSVAADQTPAEIYVIAHPGLQVTERDVREIYLGEKELAVGIRLAPVDNANEQREFLAVVLKLDVTKYNALWTKKSFRDALNPPPMHVNDAAVIQAVLRSPGGIGYVRGVPQGVVVVAKYPP